jgi:hypothetical protein
MNPASKMKRSDRIEPPRAISPEFGPWTQLKDIQVQYWRNDGVFCIEQSDGVRIDMAEDDMRELLRWYEVEIKVK